VINIYTVQYVIYTCISGSRLAGVSTVHVLLLLQRTMLNSYTICAMLTP